jgi:hypothetical protein
MRIRLLLVALGALVALVLGTSGSVAAPPNAAFVFRGELLATPSGNDPALLVDVAGGNRLALRLLVGHSSAQSFAVNSNTVYLRWAHGVPTVVSQSNLVVGDAVTIRIRAPRNSSLAQVESSPAKLVSDRGPNPGRALRPLWLFQGTLNSPAANGHLSVHIMDGNHRALKAMLGQQLDQTFTYGRRTVFILWQGRVPTLISPSQLQVGARISVRIRARGSASLGEVEATPAKHIAQHSPAGS